MDVDKLMSRDDEGSRYESPERALCLAVLERVWIDAFHNFSDKSVEVRYGNHHRQDSINFVSGREKNFKQLCWACGLDDGWVYEQFMNRLEKQQ